MNSATGRFGFNCSLQLTGCVSLGKSAYLPKAQFPHLRKRITTLNLVVKFKRDNGQKVPGPVFSMQ